MIKNKFIIAVILGLVIGLGTVATTPMVVKAEPTQVNKEHKPKTNVEAVQAVNDLIDPLIAANESNNIKELRKLVNKFHEAVNTAERIGVEDLTIESLRCKDNGWHRQLAKKEAELANANKKNNPKEEVAKPKAPVAEKKETKSAKNKAKENTEIKATEQQVEKKSNTKVEEPKKEVVKEEQITNTENQPGTDKVASEEPTSNEDVAEVKENVKKDVVTTATPVKEDTSKDTVINKVKLESDAIESSLLAKVMIIVGAVLIVVGAVTAIKVKKKN